MPAPSPSDTLLIERIRAGEASAWTELIGRFEGRLLAFVENRLRDRAASEDIVQETFIGFLISLPNYDLSRPLEGYLFSIAAHKLTDYLRREGRRPAIPMGSHEDSEFSRNLPGPARPASSLLRSGERRHLEEQALAAAMDEQIGHWRQQGHWLKIKCVELLLVRGWANQHVAKELAISEQQVANFKYEFLERLRTRIRRQNVPRDVFPELYDSADTAGNP